ncbi:hypothetical protein CAPTEDRAFT_219935 [Capitella teleta]|uniref:CUB domain-containing protein n=1 Tax=Capitella teleta TaxID=283909 RepID=R7T6B8_CAPTE|nr:hypothetical protein CAPTEDRAFT_219935 [Capitella teleta]|eukprot:ELT88985.1 hypothetical protein CAPTEDRAFT_219935 [Capitella teleta]
MEAETLAGFCFLVFFACSSRATNLGYTCGSHITPTADETGVISSPNYPANYPDYAHCIWLIVAPKRYAVKITFVDGMHGESSSGGCSDYLEIRNGSRSSSLVFSGCDPTIGQEITTSGRWLWIKFFSDEATSFAGFSLNWELVSDVSVSNKSPVEACQAVNFRCANQECVYGSYKCDGWNDCGCLGGGCDEDNCSGIPRRSATSRLALGIGVGSFVFCIIFFGIGILEIVLKKRSEIKEKKYQEESKRRAKQQRAAAKAKEAESRTLTVPESGNGDLNNSFNSSGTGATVKTTATALNVDSKKSEAKKN